MSAVFDWLLGDLPPAAAREMAVYLVLLFLLGSALLGALAAWLFASSERDELRDRIADHTCPAVGVARLVYVAYVPRAAPQPAWDPATDPWAAAEVADLEEIFAAPTFEPDHERGQTDA